MRLRRVAFFRRRKRSKQTHAATTAEPAAIAMIAPVLSALLRLADCPATTSVLRRLASRPGVSGGAMAISVGTDVMSRPSALLAAPVEARPDESESNAVASSLPSATGSSARECSRWRG